MSDCHGDMTLQRTADDQVVMIGEAPPVLGVSIELLEQADPRWLTRDGEQVTILGLRYRITGVCPRNLHVLHLERLADGAVAADV